MRNRLTQDASRNSGQSAAQKSVPEPVRLGQGLRINAYTHHRYNRHGEVPCPSTDHLLQLLCFLQCRCPNVLQGPVCQSGLHLPLSAAQAKSPVCDIHNLVCGSCSTSVASTLDLVQLASTATSAVTDSAVHSCSPNAGRLTTVAKVSTAKQS